MKCVLASAVCCAALTASLIAQVVPAFAERVTLKCELTGLPGWRISYFTFDTDALAVEVDVGWDLLSGTYRIQMTTAKITWQSKNRRDGSLNDFTYNRGTAKMYMEHSRDPNSRIIVGDCVKMSPPL
jgi:hypothetical protein